MSKLTVEDTSLVSVADAIRTKGGTTDQLVFPDGFVSAIDAIESGGGGDNYLAGVIDGSITDITADMLKGCTKIGPYAFYYHENLKSVVIPDSVTSIGNNAFHTCSGLTEVTIPNSVTSIGNNAFYACKGLTEVTIPDSVTSIGGSVFAGCNSLENVKLSSGITSIPSSAFSGCVLTNGITIPDSVTSIGGHVFSNCKFTEITIPKNVISIGQKAFNSSKNLKTVYMKPTSPPTLDGAYVFGGSLSTIVVPAGTLSAYKSATNWSKWADYMVEASS